MGLDMYLVANGYLSNYNEESTKNAAQIKAMYGDLPDSVRVSSVNFEVGYWRKANAIHKWFVDNVQKGEDDCGTYYVSEERIKLLKLTCERVIEDPTLAFDLLPPSSGFFFGSSAVDDWYFDSLRHTITVCDDAMTMIERGFTLEYHASW